VDFARGDENLRSPFYRAWVRDIDISNLLALDDLQAGEPLSVVNAAYLSRKLHEYLDFTGDGRATAAQRAWLSDPLRLKITNTNVNGTTYGIRFTQDPGRDPQDQIGHAMTTHADHLAFRRPTFLNPDGPAPPDHEPLGRDNRATDDGWARLGQAGLASLAFPGVLGMQTVERPNTDYEYRFVFADGPDRLVYARPVPHQPPGQTRFSVLDGGLVNNEPFDLAHAALAGSEGHNPRLGADAHRAVVMVDPFVNPPPHPDGPTPLLQLPLRLYEAFTQQSRFKPIDLALAQSDEVYSRFLIAPVRRARARTIRGDDALASRPLGTLMGYFCEQYRHHDFMLGRQNCYRFLRNWFCLPSGEEAGTGDAGASPRGNSLFGRPGQPGIPLAGQYGPPADHPAGRRRRRRAAGAALAGRRVRRMDQGRADVRGPAGCPVPKAEAAGAAGVGHERVLAGGSGGGGRAGVAAGRPARRARSPAHGDRGGAGADRCGRYTTIASRSRLHIRCA
jgi:hypothetical protein